MLQFIHNNFKLDLTHLKVTFNWLNPWFQTEISSAYTFPFDVPKEQWEKISNSTHYNAPAGAIKFDGQLYRDGQTEAATLKNQESKGNNVSCMIYSGLEGLSNFDKKLSQLPLDNFPVANLKVHAKATIYQNYPNVTHNFPMIHTDKYDPGSTEFANFGKIINNYENGNFIENEIAPGTNIDLVKNIMQPLPSLMHVLTKGFEDAGYQLAGDILNIESFKKAYIFRDGNYFIRTLGEEFKIPLVIPDDDWDSMGVIIDGLQYVNFVEEITIDKKGSFVIFGDINCLVYRNLVFDRSDLHIKIIKISGGVSTTIYQEDRNTIPDFFGNPREPKLRVYSVDINLELEAGDVIRFEKMEPRRDVAPFPLPDYPNVVDLKIIPLRFKNPDGSPILSLLDKQEIDLRKVVPDMTFGQLVNIIRVCKNMDVKPVGNILYMNFVQTQIDRNAAAKIVDGEVDEPLIRNNDERSYEVSYSDGKSDETYKYDSVFVDSNGMAVNNYSTKKDTTQITIDLLPYPCVKRGTVKTALAFDDDVAKLRLVYFNNLIPEASGGEEEDLPITYEELSMTIPNLVENYHLSWLKSLINSKTYQWDFVITNEKLKDLLSKALVYAYNNYHVFTEIEQERINHIYWKVTAKSETIN